MKLTPELIQKFKKIHEKYGCFDGMSDEQIERIATGVASYFLTLYEAYTKNLDISHTPISPVADIGDFSGFGKEVYTFTMAGVISLQFEPFYG